MEELLKNGFDCISDPCWECYDSDINYLKFYVGKSNRKDEPFTSYLLASGVELVLSFTTSFEWFLNLYNFLKKEIPLKNKDFTEDEIFKSLRIVKNENTPNENIIDIILTKNNDVFLLEESEGFRECFFIKEHCDFLYINNLKRILLCEGDSVKEIKNE